MRIRPSGARQCTHPATFCFVLSSPACRANHFLISQVVFSSLGKAMRVSGQSTKQQTAFALHACQQDRWYVSEQQMHPRPSEQAACVNGQLWSRRRHSDVAAKQTQHHLHPSLVGWDVRTVTRHVDSLRRSTFISRGSAAWSRLVGPSPPGTVPMAERVEAHGCVWQASDFRGSNPPSAASSLMEWSNFAPPKGTSTRGSGSLVLLSLVLFWEGVDGESSGTYLTLA